MIMANLLWEPTDDRIKKTNMYRFMNFINEKHNQDFNQYAQLHDWSIKNISDLIPKCRARTGFPVPG